MLLRFFLGSVYSFVERVTIPSACRVRSCNASSLRFIFFGGRFQLSSPSRSTKYYYADLYIEVNRRIRNAWCSFRKYTLELYDRPNSPLELKIRMLRTEVLETMLYGCVTWSPHTCHYDTLRRVHHSFLTRCIGWRKSNRTDRPISYLDTLIKTGSEPWRRLCAGGGSCLRDL